MQNKITWLAIPLISLALFSAAARAQHAYKSTGIGFRLGIWNMGNDATVLRYHENGGNEFVETAGFGGWIYFITRTSDYWKFEFSLGVFGKAEDNMLFRSDDFTDATAVIPILFGVQREFLPVTNASALRPYITFGGGPYWITDVHQNDFFDEQVVSKVQPGLFAGGGLHFFLSKSFSLDFDVKYHFVNLQTHNDLSGVEIGLGFGILWGSYQPENKNGRKR